MESIRWAFNIKNWSPLKEDWMLCLSLIQQEERDRISKFVFKRDAKASLVGRLMMRKVITENCNIPWSQFKLDRTEKGRPYLNSFIGNPSQIKLDFNVSHQGQWSVLAAENFGSNIGIDIMEIQKPSTKNVQEFFRLMKRQFTYDEWKYIKKSPCEESQLKAFYRNWCLKEAFVKALGVGISYDLQSISFTSFTELTPEILVKDTQIYLDGHIDQTWFFEECMLDQTHVVAVATQHYKENHKTMPFRILPFEDLISNSEQMLPLDDNLAEEFMHKSERP